MENSKVSFGTRIVIKDRDSFAQTIKSFAKSVDCPWTKDQIVRGPKVFTEGIATCTAGGVLVKRPDRDYFEIVKFHIDPIDKANKEVQPIENMIYRRIGKSEPLQAFIFGCKNVIDYSSKMFDSLEEVIKKLKVPYTKLKGFDINSYMSCAYDGYKDELSIFSPIIESKFGKRFKLTDIPKLFDDIKLSAKDKFGIDQPFGCNIDITDEEWKYLQAQS